MVIIIVGVFSLFSLSRRFLLYRERLCAACVYFPSTKAVGEARAIWDVGHYGKSLYRSVE